MIDYAMNQYGCSKTRACRLMKTSRSAYHYQPNKQKSDEQIKQELKQLANKYKRYGFKKMFNKLKQRGFNWNHKRVYRVYCSLGLNMRKKPKKRLPSRDKLKLVQPTAHNMTGSLDFMSDALSNGRRFRTLNVIDDCNREALGIKVGFSLTAQRVIEFLDQIALSRDYPLAIRLDNGPENISSTMRKWAEKHGIRILYIQPGKPAQNAYIERFNRTYREEVLNMYLFNNLHEVQVITGQWLVEYNYERPHESLGNLTPIEYVNKQNFSISIPY